MEYKLPIQVNNFQIQKEWDLISEKRYFEIESNIDVSFWKGNVPAILDFLGEDMFSSAIDIGCGTGHLTKILGERIKKVIGIDISERSIDIASKYNKLDNITYYISSVEEYLSDLTFDVAISNMVMMDVCNLSAVIKSIFNMLAGDGIFIFTIVHPFFWSKYRGYNEIINDKYLHEVAIEDTWRITNHNYDSNEFKTTYFHRPISKYINTLIECNFTILGIKEYGSDYNKKNDEKVRFLILKCKRGK